MKELKYLAEHKRYEKMIYRRCGQSGLELPAISLGLWQNFGHIDNFAEARQMIRTAFDLGINHFDLANNYGPPPGSAEENFGKILKADLRPYRDELIISTKAGYYMWAGPYGEWGSRKYIISSCDQSLKRMKLDYVDIFYSHRPDPKTPIEETMGALDQLVKQGKALYAGISNYDPGQTRKSIHILKELGTPCLIHQPKYSMFERTPEDGLLDALGETGTGCIAFSPLAQGLLTDKYLKGIPENSRAAKPQPFLNKENITPARLEMIRKLNALAKKRDQSLAQMAIAWLLKDERITSILTGASSARQVEENTNAIRNLGFSDDELQTIEQILISNESNG